jgi:hypothetical protein
MRTTIGAATGFLLLVGSAAGDVPPVVGYQGRITENTGVPVANGTYSIRFKLYDALTGGSLLWDSDTLSVETNAGVFSVMLGENPQDPIDLPFDRDYWLLVTFRGEDQLPRRRIGSVGYAYMASGLVPGTEVAGPVGGAVLRVVNEEAGPGGHGLYGETSSSNGIGVYGSAASTDGSAFGVFGLSAASGGRGVEGRCTTSNGVSFAGRFTNTSSNGRGVYAHTTATAGRTYAGKFVNDSSSGRSVYGWTTSQAGTTYAVYGRCETPAGYAVRGDADATTGVNYGLYARTLSPSGYAIYFSGELAGSGTKSAVVRTDEGPRTLYCQESPENWFEDFGSARVSGGRADVEIAPDFLQTVTITPQHPMKVFIAPNTALGEWWVEKSTTGFAVVAPDAPDASAFDYRVVAKRRGYEDLRLEPAPAAYTDHFLYPDVGDVPPEHRTGWIRSASAEELSRFGIPDRD